MKIYSIEAAAEQLSRLLEEACRGEDVYITRDGNPLVKMVSVRSFEERAPGGFEGKVSWTDDAFDPLTDEEIKELGFE